MNVALMISKASALVLADVSAAVALLAAPTGSRLVAGTGRWKPIWISAPQISMLILVLDPSSLPIVTASRVTLDSRLSTIHWSEFWIQWCRPSFFFPPETPWITNVWYWIAIFQHHLCCVKLRESGLAFRSLGFCTLLLVALGMTPAA